MPLVLDTHVLIWLVEGVGRLRPKIVRRIEKAAGNSAVHIAAISLWEIAMLVARRRVSLSSGSMNGSRRCWRNPG